MNGKAFFDTNIYIYLYSDDEHEKQGTSKNIINTASECIISTQILNELNHPRLKARGYEGLKPFHPRLKVEK